jgi:hypothetical protein
LENRRIIRILVADPKKITARAEAKIPGGLAPRRNPVLRGEEPLGAYAETGEV